VQVVNLSRHVITKFTDMFCEIGISMSWTLLEEKRSLEGVRRGLRLLLFQQTIVICFFPWDISIICPK